MATLTTKELSALEDQLSMEQSIVNKYQAMADLCSDTKLQKCLKDAAQKHQQHFDTLLTFLG
ncbi:MAG: spore coat protein [Oscillospiraceae bacterium]|jgi:ferritin|nr:spore coat protein [Oscillospiraceae bacterium]